MESTSLRTFVGSVLCVDLVGYSKLSVAQQDSIKQRFNGRLVKALHRVPTKDRVILDTGDGVLIGFLGDPEQCFQVALAIRGIMDAGSVRIGIHLGSVKLVPGVSGEMRIVGDGPNAAERIAALAEPGQIVVSRAFHGMVSRLSDAHETLFGEGGVRTDRLGQEHEVYVVTAAGTGAGATGPLARHRLAIGAAVVALVLAVAATAWILARRGPTVPPAVASRVEPAASPAAAKREPVAPPTEVPRESRKPPAAAIAPAMPSQSAPVPGPAAARQSAPAREEQNASPPPHPPAQAARQPGEAKKFFSAFAGGAKDVARAVGSTATGVLSTVKEKPLEPAPAAAPAAPAAPPTVVSRAALYFPQEAARQDVRSGTVRARLGIDAAGGVTSVTILSADPPELFDREAARSLKLWRFDAGAAGRTYEAELEFRR